MHQVPRYMKVTLGLAVGVAMVASVAASAQPATQSQDAQQQSQNLMSMWNPQVMIDRSVREAARRYKLTADQEQSARKMTTEGVNAFLDKHEAELRDLIRDAIQARLSGGTPTTAQVQEWAKRAAPLLEEGKKAVLDGNRQFRDVLNDEQKKTFDADQQTLQQQFAYSASVVNRWIEGKFNPDTDLPRGGWFGEPPRRPTATRPAQPGQQELDRWDLYVRGFVNRYNLDAAQNSQALGILADSKRRATEYWFSRKADIEAASERAKMLQADPDKKDQAAVARKQLEDLNRPIDTLYAEMQERLDQIPTDVQRKAFEAESQSRRDRWRDRIRRTGGNTAISATSQSQPAASQLAQAPDSQAATGSGPATRPARIFGPTATRPRTTPASQPTSQPATVADVPR